MTETRVLYDDVIPDEMVSRGPFWYATYRSEWCILTNAYNLEQVRRYDYETEADLESAMRHVRRYGKRWEPSKVVEAPEETPVSKSNPIIDAFFRAEGDVRREERE
jgi:hypothetical protein